MSTLSSNNQTILKGVLSGEWQKKDEPYGSYYQIDLIVPRLSGEKDIIPVNFPSSMVENKVEGDQIAILGQFRSKNTPTESGRNKLELVVYALSEIEPDTVEERDSNLIMLSGFICKNPIYRVTPFGREISDLLVAVNRGHKKSDYLPCIAWSTNAQIASKLVVGDAVEIVGRVQSRLYNKKLDNGEVVTKTAYEVSIIKLIESGESRSNIIKKPFSSILSNLIIKNNYQKLKTANLS